MPQSVEKTLDYASLFLEPEYKEMLSAKSKLENMPEADKVKEIADWTKSWEYREKNFAREALTINPAKSCQPLGAVFAAAGFEGTLSFAWLAGMCSLLPLSSRPPFQRTSLGGVLFND